MSSDITWEVMVMLDPRVPSFLPVKAACLFKFGTTNRESFSRSFSPRPCIDYEYFLVLRNYSNPLWCMPNYTLNTRKKVIKITIKANNAFNQRSSSRIEWKHKDQFLFSPKWSWKFKITVVVFVAVEAGGLNKMKTSYACQGDTLDLTCPSGTVIKIMRANYGRFSVGICNEHGITDWSVNCMAPRSLRILQDRWVREQERGDRNCVVSWWLSYLEFSNNH